MNLARAVAGGHLKHAVAALTVEFIKSPPDENHHRRLPVSNMTDAI
jgi:hypothetical protein